MKRVVYGFLVVAVLICSFSVAHGAEKGKTGQLKWSYDTGEEYDSSPAIGTDGTIYFGGLALNPDGSIKWTASKGGGGSSTIGTDGTTYMGNVIDHGLYALNPDGSFKWFFDAGGMVSSLPAISSDGTIYIGSGDARLYAINPDGSLKWTYATGMAIYSSPAIGSDGTIYVGSWDSNLYAINPDGSLKWTYYTGDKDPTGGDWVQSSPAIGTDRTIYVWSNDSTLLAINPDGSLKWAYATGRSNKGFYIYSSPAIGTDGTIYVGSGDKRLYAINPDGSLKWAFKAGNSIASSPAIGTDGTIYVGAHKKFYAINPDGTLQWSYAIGGEIFSSPAIGTDGTVCVASMDSKIYAFYSSSAGLANSPWPMFHHNLKHTGRFGSSPISRTLTITVSGDSSDTVTSDPTGIDCGAACRASFTQGTSVTLTATPADGSTFTGWSGGGCSGTGTCTVTMSEDVAVTANFTSPCTYTITPAGPKTFTSKGGIVNVLVTGKGKKGVVCTAPTATPDASWITATSSAWAKNKGKVVVTVAANTVSSDRPGNIVIADKTFSVTQKGATCSLKISPASSPLIPKAGGTGSFAVTATPDGCAWTAQSDTAWVTVSGGAGTGSGTVAYTVDPSTGNSTRNGKVNVSLDTGKMKKTYTVKQGNK